MKNHPFPIQLEVALSPQEASDWSLVQLKTLKKAQLPSNKAWVIQKKSESVDARKGQVLIRLQMLVYPASAAPPPRRPVMDSVSRAKGPATIIIGAGPAGYFAALRLLELGHRPIVLERGKDVLARRYDLRAIMQEHKVDGHSNYCFGEGGAGTYSDGKLYTRSDKRGDIHRVLSLLVDHGAKEDILTQSHPHIGSNKLPGVIANIRKTIVSLGGEIHFQQWVNDLEWDANSGVRVLRSCDTQTGQLREWSAPNIVLATGHSARDIFELLRHKEIHTEEKTFALGLRVEHPQTEIDKIQYRQCPRDPYLPAAAYRLVGDGVWSFCMCPGGLIVPAATAPGEIVVNGMSMSGRNSRFANSGIVVEVQPSDLTDYRPQAGHRGVQLQREIEQKTFQTSGSQKAPAQRLLDFLEQRISADLPRSSYVPGLHSWPVHELLPRRLTERLVAGFRDFGRRLPGYLSEEALVVAVESRTSSPVRIPRDPQSLAHPQVRNLYPCGEGAGYAGGIISAALDGQRVAEKIASGCPSSH